MNTNAPEYPRRLVLFGDFSPSQLFGTILDIIRVCAAGAPPLFVAPMPIVSTTTAGSIPWTSTGDPACRVHELLGNELSPSTVRPNTSPNALLRKTYADR